MEGSHPENDRMLFIFRSRPGCLGDLQPRSAAHVPPLGTRFYFSQVQNPDGAPSHAAVELPIHLRALPCHATKNSPREVASDLTYI